MTITRGVLVVIWGFILIVVTIGNTVNRSDFESPTPVSDDFFGFMELTLT